MPWRATACSRWRFGQSAHTVGVEASPQGGPPARSRLTRAFSVGLPPNRACYFRHRLSRVSSLRDGAAAPWWMAAWQRGKRPGSSVGARPSLDPGGSRRPTRCAEVLQVAHVVDLQRSREPHSSQVSASSRSTLGPGVPGRVGSVVEERIRSAAERDATPCATSGGFPLALDRTSSPCVGRRGVSEQWSRSGRRPRDAGSRSLLRSVLISDLSMTHRSRSSR